MQKSTLVNLCFPFLFSCVPLRQPLPPAATIEEINKYATLEHSLKDDPVHFAALREFYCQSSTLEHVEDDPWQHLVVLRSFDTYTEEICVDSKVYSITRTIPSFAHGYLMDDCGLVLTSYHHIRDWRDIGREPMHMIDREGQIYPVSLTDFQLPEPDYALVIADTGKEPSSHPLKFHSSFSHDSIQFATLHPSSYASEQVSLPMKMNAVEGNLVSLEDFLSQVGQLRYARCSDQFNLDPLAKESIDRSEQRHALYLSKFVYMGNSGTPLFAEDFTFLGLIYAYWTPRTPEDGIYRPYCGYGLALPSDPFIRSLEDYLQIPPSVVSVEK
ncbi:MAG: hypothetical protein AABX72_01110 [Nanoarchaeota archaeon]